MTVRWLEVVSNPIGAYRPFLFRRVKNWRKRVLKLVLVCLSVCGLGLTANVCLAADDRVDYGKEIKPILRKRCFACHGALKQRAGLRLDTVELMIRGGDSGAVIAPGDPSNSILLERVAAADAGDRMPPEHEGEPLSAEQVRLIRDWIAMGSPAPVDEQPESDASEHWAFQPVTRPLVPPVRHMAWSRNPVDAFLSRQHQQHGLTPQPEAPRIVLLRRLYLDLIGIPPTAEEITAFENDRSPGWYERTVDRLLHDPRHGERWARHWMDIWRYSDWWGLGDQLRRSQKHIWHWRDWIIESLNSDTPYDEMVRLMLAADELYPNDLGKLRATGYLARNYWLFNRNQWMEETVEHVSKGFLGLTMNCAKCHDHKYDPIAQVDFYRMRAFFEPYHVRLDVVPGQPDLTRDGIPRVFDGWIDRPTYRFIRGQEKNPDKSTVITPGVPANVSFDEMKIDSVALPVQACQPERRSWVIDAYLTAARDNLKAAKAAVAAVRKELDSAANEQGSQGPEQTPNRGEPPASNVDAVERQQELKVAEAAVDVAAAKMASIEQTAEAMRAAWAVADNKSDDTHAALADVELERRVAAVRAERELAVAKARHSVTVAELELLRATERDKNAAEKKRKATQESLDKAVVDAKAEIKASDQYTRLEGAKWTPTRFLFSGKDDPTVEFVSQSTGRRTALARWITDRRNPLTARVAANHIWTRHMGEPLVRTVFDFGRNGALPTHPELLNWLAAELMDSGWDMKHLHRIIVTSAAYRMSSSRAGGENNAAADPDNRYWWRRVPIRLESQLVRDSILAHAGMLDLTMSGPSVPRTQQDASTRRSVYFFHSNNERNQFLKTFDEALVTECYRREQSIVPQQALALTNSRLVLDTTPQIAKRLSPGNADDSTFIRKSFAVLLGIKAGDEEVAAGNKALEAWRTFGNESAEHARANLVWALINHNDYVTLR